MQQTYNKSNKCRKKVSHCYVTAAGRQKNKKKLLKERIAEKDEKDKQLQQQQQTKKPVFVVYI